MYSVTLFVAILFLFLLQIIKGNILDVPEAQECSNYRGHRPYIWSLNEAFPEYVRPGDPRITSIDNSSAIELTNNVYQLQQFNCSYHEPIHWVFHFDPEAKSIDIVIDFSERIMKSSGEKHEPKYEFTANFRLLYYLSDLQENMLFSCEPVSISNKCERKFVQVLDGKLENDPTSFPDESLTKLADELFESSKERTITKHFHGSTCPLKLFLKPEAGNVIGYRWETQNGTTKGIDKSTKETNETSYLENVYRFHKTQEPHCVRVLNPSETCSNCRYVGKVTETINFTVNAVIFHAIYNDASLLYKGLFSVPKNMRSERIFYLDWQISDSVLEKQMIKLLIPEKVYTNVTFSVVCRVSVFFFAYGSQITDKESPDFNESILVESREFSGPYGYREIVQKLRFQEINEVKTMACFSPLKNSNRWVVKQKAVLVELASSPKIGNTFENTTEFRSVSEGVEFIVIECKVSGNPIPSLKWILPSKLLINDSKRLNVTKGKNSLELRFPKWDAVFAGTYICEATNFLGLTTKSITFQNKESNSKLAIIISSSLGSLALLLGTLIGILGWKIRRQRLEFEIQTQKAIEEFRNGIKTENMPEVGIQDPNFSILQMPYNEAFEIPQNKWVIEDKILGTGQFGIVRLGSVMLKTERVTVAVKSLKSSVEIDEFKSFLFELKIMAYLGHHKNIVSLIAACTEGIDNRDIVLGVEFCDNGSLLDYMRKYRTSFLNMVESDGKIISELPPTINRFSEYANIANMSVISTHQLYRWAYHVACGMDYLRLRKVLHGDLAARNVLLTSRKVAKIGDFGLSRVLMNSENYTKRTQTALPWKWMAIESLSQRVFSVNSDVWAYGVCLYEIFTLGQSPYPGIGWSPDFITQLENGMRMEQPVYCTAAMYKIMRACWENDPHQRPSYIKIKRKLSKGLQRLSALLSSNKEDQEQNPPSSTASTHSHSQPTSLLSPVEIPDILDLDDAGIYSNLPRRTMNYYKNC